MADRAAEPVYETPRLLGYRCAQCGWTGDDPAAQARQKQAEAPDAAGVAVGQAVKRVADALATLSVRGAVPVPEKLGAKPRVRSG